MNACMRLDLSRFKYGLFLVLTLGERDLLKLVLVNKNYLARCACSGSDREEQRTEAFCVVNKDFLGSQEIISKKGVLCRKVSTCF